MDHLKKSKLKMPVGFRWTKYFNSISSFISKRFIVYLKHELVGLFYVFVHWGGGGWGWGHSLKNMWRVCAAILTPIFKPPVTEWPLFIFHILLSPNDPHFQNTLSLNDPLFLEIFIGENGHYALTEWRPFSPINDYLVICTQYLFGRRDLCSC